LLIRKPGRASNALPGFHLIGFIMHELNDEYIEQLEAIAGGIQESEELAAYLESEEEADYKALVDLYEPLVVELYHEVEAKSPLQIIPLENVLLNSNFEGLYLPKILAYNVLRGEIDSNFKYIKPQDQFKNVLLAISESSNFDWIKNRIGQTTQIGFALSSDIWITNILNNISNKKVKSFLVSKKDERLRDLAERKNAYLKYKNQFSHASFHTSDFPTTIGELKTGYGTLKEFLLKRIELKGDNSSFIKDLTAFLTKKEFIGTPEHFHILCMYLHFIQEEDQDYKNVVKTFEEIRKSDPNFTANFFKFILDSLNDNFIFDKETHDRFYKLLDHKAKDELSEYLKLMEEIHGKGMIHPDAMEAVKMYYDRHEGMSSNNQAVRAVLIGYIRKLMNNLPLEDYSTYFTLNLTFHQYMKIFNNQSFNQELKKLGLNYINKLMIKYIDKRGKDYQDIKRFVATNYVEMGFLKEKEVIELFKSKRKILPVTPSKKK
jgi:hypothetical protein